MKRNFGKRIYVLSALVILVMCVFVFNLARIQLVEGEENAAPVATANSSVAGIRGEIVDRNGNILVYNKQISAVRFDYAVFPSSKDMTSRVKIISSLIKLFEANASEWRDTLPLAFDESGSIVFTDDESAITYMKSADYLNLNSYATAQNCFDALAERYGVEQGYDSQMQRKIISVCYGMKREDFSDSLPFTFAESVSDELAAKIKENSSYFQGVDVVITSEREFTDSTLAPHILGITGVINAEEYAEKKNLGYGMTDITGKSGIELAMEETLRGTSGTKTTFTDSDGNKTSKYTKDPEPGSTVMLTIDAGLQRVAQDALEKRIDELQYKRAYEMSGSVVALDVKSGEVLACATWPSYDAATYNDNYSVLSADENAPLWNRALMSSYTPGSTIKIAVAMGALEDGIIDENFRVICHGRYYYYRDYQPKCIGYHGKLDVTHAIFNSCNIFFYETSRLMGITALNKYFSAFGLGTKTGVELSEAEGNIDSVAYRESVGDIWTPGLTLQAGIGHAANLFTPIQLCNYAAMTATRGTRYRAHFVKSELSYDGSKIINETKPEILAQVNFKSENWDMVQEGMRLVAQNKVNFDAVDATVAAKTGTTTLKKTVNGKSIDTNNGILVAYAPYNNPEIAVCVVIEGASSGGSTAPVVSAMLEYYFSEQYGSAYPATDSAG